MAASPQLLIIDSVLMSALLGRRAPGTAVILTVPPIVKPPLPPLLVASLVQREPGPDCHRAMGGRGWLGDILGPVVIARDLRWWAAGQLSPPGDHHHSQLEPTRPGTRLPVVEEHNQSKRNPNVSTIRPAEHDSSDMHYMVAMSMLVLIKIPTLVTCYGHNQTKDADMAG